MPRIGAFLYRFNLSFFGLEWVSHFIETLGGSDDVNLEPEGHAISCPSGS